MERASRREKSRKSIFYSLVFVTILKFKGKVSKEPQTWGLACYRTSTRTVSFSSYMLLDTGTSSTDLLVKRLVTKSHNLKFGCYECFLPSHEELGPTGLLSRQSICVKTNMCMKSMLSEERVPHAAKSITTV